MEDRIDKSLQEMEARLWQMRCPLEQVEKEEN